jgi:hypothetical protein
MFFKVDIFLKCTSVVILIRVSQKDVYTFNIKYLPLHGAHILCLQG